MKVLVTGANGYLGQGVVKQLLDDGIEVVATDLSDEYIDSRAKTVSCNIFEEKDPYNYFDRPDVVLHMAWRDGFVHNSINHINDLPQHANFLRKMASQGVKKIAVMGTMHEIGFYEGSIDETTPCRPQSLYGIGKDSLRNITTLIAKEYNINYLWLRGYYIVGNSEYGNSIFSKITSAVRQGKKTFPFTLGQNQYDFIDYDEFCLQVAAAIEQDVISGIINICSGKPEKLADCVERFIKENEYDIELQYGEFPDRPYDSKAVWGNNSKIAQILNERKKKITEHDKN